ncbi:MAG: integrase [Rhizobiales bacterium]|nr:integrase [Hyphomicrobiales bacterium]
MVRRPEPPHLYLRPAKYVKGKLRARAVWCIVDGGTEKSTGFGLEQREKAEQALAEYIEDKHEPSRRKGQSIDDILIADVCAIYLRDRVPEQKRPEKAAASFVQLLEWWGEKTLGEINGRSCRDYVEWRCSHAWKSAKPDVTGKPPRMVTPAGARRELEDLRAAVNYHQAEGYHREIVRVTLPPKGKPRHRYLRRSELARMVWVAWRRREDAKVVQGPRKGSPTKSSRRPSRHIARFLLVGAYTGTRAAAIGSAAFEPTPGHGWGDLKSGLFYRAEEGARETNKRQPTILLPRRLLMHLRRWKRANPKQRFVVEWNGKPVREVNNGFAKVAALAGLRPEVIPHTLRHTCATWLSQRGASMADAAGYLGMSQEVFERVYRHHSPTLRIAGFVNPPIWEIFDPKYRPAEIVLDDGWVEEEAA